MSVGKNVYAETVRYNYGPLWALLLGGYTLIASQFANVNLVYRLLIVTTLIAGDSAIYIWIKKMFGNKSAYWFFLNPISIYITGYHNQFDTIAIAFALYASSYLFSKKRSLTIMGILLLGLSIAIKHVFIFYPLWLFLRSKNSKERIISCIPIVLFILSFIPFIFAKGAVEGIWNNVLSYKNSISLYPFIPGTIVRPFLMLLPMCLGAYCARNEKPTNSILLYLLLVVAISPIAAGQYFIIPLAAFAAFSIPAGILFSLVAALALLFEMRAFSFISILAFALCWLPLLTYSFKRIRKITNIFIFSAIGLLFLYCSFLIMTSGIQIMKGQKKEFYIMRVLHPAWRVFPSQIRKPLHIVNTATISGQIEAQSDNLGFITVPYLLVNPSKDFFKRGYTIQLKAQELSNTSASYSETRKIEGGLTQDGILLGMPILSHSSGKRFAISVSSSIQKGPDFITIDPFAFVQTRYFLTRSHVLVPSFFPQFIWNKIFYFFSLKESWRFCIQLYLFFWALLSSIWLIKNSKTHNE